MKHSIIILLVLLTMSGSSFAQEKEKVTANPATQVNITTGSLSGIVTGENNLPLEGAVITLHRVNDSVLVKGGLTDAKGLFSISITPGTYLVKTSFVGLLSAWNSKVEVTSGKNVDMNTVVLKSDGKQLTGVVVTSRRSVIQQKIDMTVINVNETVRKEANNALDVIRMAPGVFVSDNEDEITISGKDGVWVMLNGKVIRLTGRDLIKLLKSLPVSAVSQLEIMTNPSSKFDVPGSVALLNVKTKKNTVSGLNGSAGVEHSQAANSMSDFTLNLNYGVDKFYITSYMAHHRGYYPTNYTEDRFVTLGADKYNFSKTGVSTDKWSDPVIRINADYFINRRHTIGALIELEKSTNTASNIGNTFISEGFNAFDSSLRSSSITPNSRIWKTFNLNYRYADTLGSEFNFDIDHSYFKKEDNKTVSNMLFNNANIGKMLPDNFFNTTTNIKITTIKGDYTKTYKNNSKLEAGFKFSFVKTDDGLMASVLDNGFPKVDSNLTNNFLYRENVTAGYVNYSKSIGKWGFQLGLRLERSDINGVSTDIWNNKINRPDSTYYNLLPSAYLSYLPSWKHSFRLAFVNRITRPDYEDLQPFSYQIDLQNFHIGNPSLVAQRNMNLELTYTYKQSATVTAGYTHVKDFSTPVNYQVGTLLYETVANTGIQDRLNMNISYPVKIKKWWSATNEVSVFYNYFKGQIFDAFVSDGGTGYTLYSRHRFVLPGEFILSLSGRYTSAYKNLVSTMGQNYSVNTSIGKRIFKGKSIVRIGVSDIFNTQARIVDINFNGLKYTQRSTWESRRLSLEFSYRFGSNKIKDPRERNTGNGDEKGRAGK
jgi:iron complex outermembrane recepter protein